MRHPWCGRSFAGVMLLIITVWFQVLSWNENGSSTAMFSNALILLQPIRSRIRSGAAPTVDFLTSSTLFMSLPQKDNNEPSLLQPLKGLRVAIVGGGPSGLLLSHRLLQSGATVNLFEKRPRPTSSNKAQQQSVLVDNSSSSNKTQIESRAYALGVGIRGRTAIQSVDQQLWQAIKTVGYASERFILHLGPFSIRLRDEGDSVQSRSSSSSSSKTGGAEERRVEPSLLLFQSDLCRVLADELEQRWGNDGGGGARLNIKWNSAVQTIDLTRKTLVTETNDKCDFDLLVGCDGVNSVVRKAMDKLPAFKTRQELIPGLLKVVKLPHMPPNIDPTAVQLLFPKSGSVSAFVEPTVNGTCCVLFAGRNATDVLLSSNNVTAVSEELEVRFPKLVGADLKAAAQQMVQNGNPTQASLVTCNTYHCGGTAALVGDAAHATGGVSGQGVNSALVDAAVLADCLALEYDHSGAIQEQSLGRALLVFSQRAVPEGKALYDLSFGPRPTSVFGKIRFGISSARDSIFKGRFGIGQKPLQTMLTTSLRSFADIRRDRDRFYDETFMDQSSWNATVTKLDIKLKEQLMA